MNPFLAVIYEQNLLRPIVHTFEIMYDLLWL
jgi:hypothetical protein